MTPLIRRIQDLRTLYMTFNMDEPRFVLMDGNTYLRLSCEAMRMGWSVRADTVVGLTIVVTRSQTYRLEVLGGPMVEALRLRPRSPLPTRGEHP